jgi:1-deoxy-D-xylulose 5-phosphate reductoisomerase
VEAFLAGRLPFAQIVPACHSILENHHFNPNPTLAEALAADRWARQEVSHWIGN